MGMITTASHRPRLPVAECPGGDEEHCRQCQEPQSERRPTSLRSSARERWMSVMLVPSRVGYPAHPHIRCPPARFSPAHRFDPPRTRIVLFASIGASPAPYDAGSLITIGQFASSDVHRRETWLTEQLMEYFKFDSDDLYANQNGRFTEKQRVNLIGAGQVAPQDQHGDRHHPGRHRRHRADHRHRRRHRQPGSGLHHRLRHRLRADLAAGLGRHWLHDDQGRPGQDRLQGRQRAGTRQHRGRASPAARTATATPAPPSITSCTSAA